MQAIPGEIKALVILISNEIPDENTNQNTVQSVHRQAMCFNAISSLTSGLGMHDEEESLHSWVKVDQAVRPLPPKRLSILKT